MRGWGGRLLVGAVVALGLAAGLTSCGPGGDLTILNEGPTDATVSTGDQTAVVPHSGGVSLLDYGCTPGDARVTLGSGQLIVLAGPICPDQEIVITETTARVVSHT